MKHGAADIDGLDLDWSDWIPLQETSSTDIPRDPGLYRVRHEDAARDSLEYIGESGNTGRRVQSLSRGTYLDEMPYRDPHTAAPCLWAIRDAVGPDLQLSYTTPSAATDDQHRKGMEDALIALHRREFGQSPTANYGRMIDGYKQSTYSHSEPCYVGGPLDADETEPNTDSGTHPLQWAHWRSPRAENWMGFEWSTPYRLADRIEADPPDEGLYRIWDEDATAPLAYIGESSNISSRLYKHENTYGGDALFAFATREDLDAAHKRSEVETDLIGAYYLSTGEAPLAQYGYTEALPD